MSFGKISLIALFFIPVSLWGSGIPYSVDFRGLSDAKALTTLRSLSELVALNKKLPSSVNALRFRAESDVPGLVRALHSLGYLEAQIEVKIEEQKNGYVVVIQIHPGPLYTIDQYRIEFEMETNSEEVPHLSPTALGIRYGLPADTRTIIDAELCALHSLSQCGYPLATIKERNIVANGKTKGVDITLTIETGPLSHFGPTSIEGNTSVCDALIEQQVQWCLEEVYDSSLVECTQTALMDTGLFSSVFITHDPKLDVNQLLPMKIEVCETKHRSVSAGASFQTTFGPGASLGWENRNIGGMGRRLTFQADVAERNVTGIATFLVPNFYRVGQSYIVRARAWRESIKPYRSQSYSLLNRFDRQENEEFFYSFGAKAEYMIVENSVDNGNFFLIEAPIYLRWTNVEDFLNPLSGLRVEYRGVPAVNIKDVSDFYYSQVLMLSTYWPLGTQETLVLAQKLTFGTIISNGLGAVPVPKRFFGGSEDNLRGYKYYTVSPLDKKGKPIGGRSAIYYTLEPRFRLSESFGLVPFFDVGNVYVKEFPTFRGKWRKSVGIGVRYFSFIGPLRLDVAFPLDRREGIDPHWWIFVSMGQTF